MNNILIYTSTNTFWGLLRNDVLLAELNLSYVGEIKLLFSFVANSDFSVTQTGFDLNGQVK